jgi:hypothetical protein
LLPPPNSLGEGLQPSVLRNMHVPFDLVKGFFRPVHHFLDHPAVLEAFPMRALMVAMVLCAMTDQPTLATTFTWALFHQISPTMRHALGVPKPPNRHDQKGWDAVYQNVLRRFRGLIQLMDPSANPKNLRLSDQVFSSLVERNRTKHTDAGWDERQDRLQWFINEVIEISLRTLPREIRRRWVGSSCVDATVVPAFARPDRREGRSKKNRKPIVITHSSDPDADWYRRDQREGEDGQVDQKRLVWGYEASLVVSGVDGRSEPGSFPTLVMGMAPLHKPGVEPGRNAVRALRSIHDRGHPAHFLAADRGYTNAKPDDFQLPARALGYSPVLDYKIDQLGHQGSFAGMLLVDGAWYCPSIPEVLVSCTYDHRKGLINDATYQARLGERRNYQILTEDSADQSDHRRMRCPASNPNPVARCELKPGSKRSSTRGRITIPVKDATQGALPKICAQQSITVPPDAGAKYRQELLHESPEWHATYGALRSSVEGMNGYLKDGAHQALDDPERRRIRGVAAQSVLVAFQILGANLRKIDMFVAREEAEEAGVVRRLPARRRTKPLSDWGPAPVPFRVEAGPSGPGPDPPPQIA